MSETPSHSIVVTIHDQDLLLSYEAEGKFAGFDTPVTYVFVGKGAVDKLTELTNVVVARDLPDNIEDHKYLVDFTSWYACIRNDIPLGETVSLIQYDVLVSEDFTDKTQQLLAETPDTILGYAPVEMKNRNFIRDNMGYAPLLKACKDVYALDIGQILKSHMKLSSDKMWPATNNVAMHRDTLREFVRWFTPLAMAMGNHKPVGHSFERAIKLFGVLTGHPNVYAPELLSHFQLNSHETQDFTKDTKTLHGVLARNVRSKTRS